MSTSDSCKDGASKSNNDDVCEVNNMLHNMSTADKDDVSVCANCGKEGSGNNMNTCNKCKMVKYCNAVCKKVHKKKHKKDCEEYQRLAAEKHNEELRIAAELHDEKLFKQPPPDEDCPICFQQLPVLNPTGKKYKECCGKTICSGCIHAPVYDNQGNKVDNEKCPFCRAPWPDSEEEAVERIKKRIEMNDPLAMHNLGCFYGDGTYGFSKDYTKALEYWHQAAELGDAKAYNSIGCCYDDGIGVKVDKKKAIHYYELAAMEGNVKARYNLGFYEIEQGNMDRAVKHFMIAVRGGYDGSLDTIKQMYSKGYATKDDYMKVLQLYQAYLSEIKSPQRDEAAAFADEYRYY